MNRRELMGTLPKGLVIAELGVFIGVFSEQILRAAKPSLLYLVDTWEGEWKSGYEDTGNYITVNDMSTMIDGLRDRFKDDEVVIAQGTSLNFLRAIKNLDAVYIDSTHTDNMTMKELQLCKRKGIKHILGHDYAAKFGVKEAVDKFLIENSDYEMVRVTDEVNFPSFYMRLKQ